MTSAFSKQLLDSHNSYRELHSTEPLQYDENLAKGAQKWADKLAKQDKLEHDAECNKNKIGENVAMKYNSATTDFPGSDFTDQWYSEIADYNFDNVENQIQCGHFTQVVWKASQKCGFGRAVSDSGRVYVVGRYSPGGNYVGQFVNNVAPPKDGKIQVPESMQSKAPADGPATENLKPIIGPNDPDDVLISSRTSTKTEGKKTTTTIEEKYRSADGSTYSKTRQQISTE